MNKFQEFKTFKYSVNLEKIFKIFSFLLILTLSAKSWSQTTCAPTTSGDRSLPAAAAVTLKSSPAHKSNVVYPAGNVLAATSISVVTDAILSNAALDTSLCRFWRTYVEAPSGAVAVPGLSYNGAQVFKTKIPGIGYAVRVSDNSTGATFYSIPVSGRTTVFTDPKGQTNATISKAGFKVELTLVSTGETIPVGTHTINDVLGVVSAANKNGDVLSATRVQIKANATFIVPALSCSLQYGSQLELKLPTVSSNLMKQWQIGANSEEGPESNVATLRLNCPATIALHATFVDAKNKSNISNALSIEQSAGAAQGVGIILMRQHGSSGENVWRQANFGPESTDPNNINQARLHSAYEKPTYTILNFKARYVRTAKTITAGPVKASALIVFSYQ